MSLMLTNTGATGEKEAAGENWKEIELEKSTFRDCYLDGMEAHA